MQAMVRAHSDRSEAKKLHGEEVAEWEQKLDDVIAKSQTDVWDVEGVSPKLCTSMFDSCLNVIWSPVLFVS